MSKLFLLSNQSVWKHKYSFLFKMKMTFFINFDLWLVSMADSSTDACPPETDSQTEVTLGRPGSSSSSTSSDDSGTMAVEIPSQRNTEVVLTQNKSGVRKVQSISMFLIEHHALYALELLQDYSIFCVELSNMCSNSAFYLGLFLVFNF